MTSTTNDGAAAAAQDAASPANLLRDLLSTDNTIRQQAEVNSVIWNMPECCNFAMNANYTANMQY